VDRLRELLGLPNHLLDTRRLGLLELLGALLDRLLGALAERLCELGLPQQEGLLKMDDLREISQHSGSGSVAGLHRLSVRPLGVRLELLELVDGLRDLLRDGLIERLWLLLLLLLLILLSGLLLRSLAAGSLLR